MNPYWQEVRKKTCFFPSNDTDKLENNVQSLTKLYDTFVSSACELLEGTRPEISAARRLLQRGRNQLLIKQTQLLTEFSRLNRKIDSQQQAILFLRQSNLELKSNNQIMSEAFGCGEPDEGDAQDKID